MRPAPGGGFLAGARRPAAGRSSGGSPASHGPADPGELALERRAITVISCGGGAIPDLGAIAGDPRLASRAKLAVATEPPAGDDDDAIVIVRADRVFHRDMPRQVIAAWRGAAAGLAKVAGAEHDAVFVAARDFAPLARGPAEAGGLAGELGRLPNRAGRRDAVPLPGVTASAHVPGSAGRAPARLVCAQVGRRIAEAAHRRLSLRSRGSCSSPVHPTHHDSALVAHSRAESARTAATSVRIGMLLVELGSIVDGIDGELARLRFQFSRLGQWLDTTCDDLGNVAYATGVAINLHLAGAGWAVPLAAAALTAFALTQGTQYYLLVRVYRSGDLAAIPVGFQSSTSLAAARRSSRGARRRCPRCSSVYFAVTAVRGVRDRRAPRADPVRLLRAAFVFFTIFAVHSCGLASTACTAAAVPFPPRQWYTRD